MRVRSGKRKNLSSKDLLQCRSVTFKAESQFSHFRPFAAFTKEEQNPFCSMNLGCQKIKKITIDFFCFFVVVVAYFISIQFI